MLYLELKINILPPHDGNDKRHKTNSSNHMLKHLIYQIHLKKYNKFTRHEQVCLSGEVSLET